MLHTLLLAALLSCDREDPPNPAGDPSLPDPLSTVEEEPDWLSPVEHLVRVSIATRGIRPSADEVAAVTADPTALASIVDQYLDSPEFGRTIEDMHGELYRVRVDIAPQYPALGPLEGVDVSVIHRSSADEPLRLVSDIVMNDRPYTDVVTADWIIADQSLALMFGLPFDPEGPEYQQTWWSDGRPAAGILSSSEFYHRYPSNGNNFHRGRASVAADIFLCDEIAARDTELSVESAPPSTSVDQLIDTLGVPGCAGCHSALEPLASFFWGFMPVLPPAPLARYMKDDCVIESYDDREDLPPGAGYAQDLCYPIRMYTPANEDLGFELGLPAPSLYGASGDRIDDLGRLITEDPRFATCTATRFTAWFGQVGRDSVDPTFASTLAEHFVASGYSARELAREILLSDRFRQRNSLDPSDPEVGLLTVRPEQYATQIADLTGFQWLGEHRTAACEETFDCWGVVDLARSDLYGFRAMAGGIDGIQQTTPVHTPTPTRQLVMDRFASEAAGFVVDADFALPAAERRLLTGVEADDTDEAPVRAQLVALELRILTEVVPSDGPEVDAAYTLFTSVLATGASPLDAWKLVLVALLTDPQMVVY